MKKLSKFNIIVKHLKLNLQLRAVTSYGRHQFLQRELALQVTFHLVGSQSKDPTDFLWLY